MRVLLWTILLNLNFVCNAADLEREQRLADQIVDAIMDGEAQMLEASGHEFLSIYTESDEPAGAVLILHGRGFHPDWADAINPLRTGLIEYGWNTLSIQLPVLEKQAKYYDYVPVFPEATPRIESAIRFLKEQGNEKVILLAHSCGVHMAMQYVREKGEVAFDAFVGIGLGATDYKQPMKEPFPLSEMKKPILDIFGSDDYPAVHRLAALRAQVSTENSHVLNEQKKIPGANHYFTDKGADLVKAVGPWLENIK